MMNPYSGFKRGRSWDEAELSSFGSPKLGRFDDVGAMSRPGGQQHDSQGFRGELSGNYGHQEQGGTQGASGKGFFSSGSSRGRFERGGAGGARCMDSGNGSTISRLMDLATDSGGSSRGGFSGGSSIGGFSGDSSRRGFRGGSSRGGFGGGGTGGARGMERGTGSTISRLLDLATDSGGSSRGGFSGDSSRGGFSGGSSRGGFSGGSSRGEFNSGSSRAGCVGGGAGGDRGMERGAGSTISRLMDMASGSGGGSRFAGSGSPSAESFSQGGDSTFADYSGWNQRQHSDYGGDGGGGAMHSQSFGGRGGSAAGFGNPHRAGGFDNFHGAGGGERFISHGYDTTPQFGLESAGFDVGGGSYNQNQFSSDQRAGGWGGGRGGFGHQHCEGQGGFSQHGGGQRGRGERGRSGQVVCRGGRGDDGGHAGAPRVGGRGGSGDHRGRQSGDWSQGSGEDGGSHSGDTPGHGGKVFTRPNGSTYRHNEHSLLQYSAKFQENKLPMAVRFVNLCKMAKLLQDNMPTLAMASTTLEQFLLSDNVCLTPAYVFKGVRVEDKQPFKCFRCKVFRCKVYINNIFIASGVADSTKKAKHEGCNAAIKVLGTENAEVIIATHEKVNVMELGKQDADIVECPLSYVESNIGNILSVPESSEKKSWADFYIKEPEENEGGCNNSTGILRQSADFSKLLLKYEYTASPQGGFLCTVNMEGKTLATATATQQNTAKNLASHAALQNLRQTNWTILVIKRDKPKPAAKPLTATLGRIHPNDPYSHEQFTEKLRAYLMTYFAGLEDHTKWLPLSQELDHDERYAVHTIAAEMNLRVESKRVDGKRWEIGPNDPMFLVVSKKLLCQDLFDYIWEKGGETWRYKLKAPGEITPNME